MQSWLSSLFTYYQCHQAPKPLKAKLQHTGKKYVYFYRGGRPIISTIILASTLCLVGCDNTTQPTDKQTVTIKSDEIILPKDTIWSTNPERYQPSFNLYGTLVPIAQATIVAPYSGNITSFLVANGDWVEQQQDLLHIATIPIAMPSPTASYTQPSEAEQQTNTSTKTQVTITGYNNRVPTSIAERKVDATNALEDEIEEEIEELTADIDSLEEDSSSTNTTKSKETTPTKPIKNLIVKAPFSGKVSDLITSHSVEENQVLMKISDTSQLQLIGELPISTQSQLSIGQNVNFTIPSTHETFTGQISKITPDRERQMLTVHAPVTSSRVNKAHLKSGMSATMSIEYGQIQVGVRLPATAIHNVDLSILTAKHPRPAAPLEGDVWVIKQDQHLELHPVQIVAYFADTQQYLVSGVNNDSLICVADLPLDSEGKKVSVH